MAKFNSHEIESSVKITREKYEAKAALSKGECVSYDDFIQNITDAVNENNGTLEDAEFIAEDAVKKL